MMNRVINKIVFVWALLLILMAVFGKVTVAAENGGRTAADFLQIGLGARAAGMGGAFSATSDDAGASYWNPAGLTSVPNSQVEFGHFSWYQDINLEYGMLAFKTNEKTSVALSLTYLGYGQIDGYDLDGNPTGQALAAYDWAGGLSVAYQVNPALSVGLTGKFINQRLDDISGSAFAADLGARYRFEKFTLAAVFSNIGTSMDFDGVNEKLPASFRLAASVYPFGPSFATSFEFDNRFQNGLIFKQGLEYCYDSRYFIRTGYSYMPQADGRAFGQGLSFGVGAIFNKAQLDYAYTPSDGYASSDLHRVSFKLYWGK